MQNRTDKIYQRMQEQVKQGTSYWSGKPPVNMLADPEYLQMSYMQRKAQTIKARIENSEVRILPDELLGGSFIETSILVLSDTYEERKMYADTYHAYPARNNRIVNGKQIYSSKILRVPDEQLRDPAAHYLWSWGHTCGGFRRILEMGYTGIIKTARDKIDEMKASGNIDPERIEFWESVIIDANAVCDFSNRHGDELERMAKEETDPVRAAELTQMAKNMRRVPAYPAETYWEAVQSIWFSWLCNMKNIGTDLGRLDQYLYPYYKKDLEAGIITKEQAQELIENLFLKFYELYIVTPNNKGVHPAIMLGGLNADGKDGTNDITYMCLLTKERFVIPNPKLSLRVNEQTPMELYKLAHRMLMKGINQPDFYADRVFIPAYERIGVPFEDAVEYAQSSCEELSLAGLSEDCTNEGPHCDIHDKVELAMRRVDAGEKADTFEDFMAMVEEEIRLCLREEMEFHVEQTEKLRIFNPQPLHSAAIVGCLESGRDITAGGAKYNNTGTAIGGLATAADGMYAIKRLVYEEKRMSLKEFHQILMDDYKDNEVLRIEILHKFPKFGNDDDRVDLIAAHLFDVYADELEKHPNSRGGIYKVGAWASEYRSAYMATPDGRHQGDAFAVNVSPTPGCDLEGATAVIKSGTKLNMKICTAGAMLDIAMSPSCLRGENGPTILKQLITTYGNMGGGGLQFNILDADVLKAAQEDPMRYRTLMVRVWGYNDYFISVEKRVQDHIISRTIHQSL